MNKIATSNNLWGLMTIIGIIISIYPYIENIHSIKPVYAFKGTPLKIYTSENPTSKIKIYAQDSTQITGNIYTASLVIWNAGKEEIKKEDVRQPISILLDINSKILDYSIINETQPHINKFKVKKIEDFLLTFDWQYFDPGAGCEIQLIYAAKDQGSIHVGGLIQNIYIEEVEKEININIQVGLMLLGFILLGITIPRFILLLYFKKSNHSSRLKKLLVSRITSSSIMFLVLVVIFFVLSLVSINTLFGWTKIPF